MINNDVSSYLSRYLGNRGTQSGTGNVASEVFKRLKAKHDSIHGRGDASAEDEQAKTDKAAEESNRIGKGFLRQRKAKDGAKEKTAETDASDSTKLTPEERRKKELQAILDKINAEEEARTSSRKPDKKTEAADKSEVVSPENAEDVAGGEGFMSFLNDMPLFNEFKSGLIDAFKMLDSASAGTISAQYELNYTTMQYVANEAGGFEYKETTLNVKLDLNYIKAAAGGQTGKSIADIISGSEDFESLISNLKAAGQGQPQKTQPTPQDFMTGLQDYFSPEKTAGRILDFATAFFPTSEQFKAKGDTEEAREEFAEIMRKAIQKGFDQAMGTLGAVPKETQDGIDKTHELVFKGIDDFVKNGMNKDKQDQGVYQALEQFLFSAEISYSEKSYSVSSSTTTYNRGGTTQDNKNAATPSVDTQA